MLHRVSLSNPATALDTTASISPTCCRTACSSARPRTTVISTPRSSMTSRRKSVRRRSGSISVTRKSGRANANGIPGSPAPLPMSAIWSPGSSNSVRATLLSRCRSHRRSASRGTDEAALDSRARQDPGVAHGLLQAVAEDVRRLRRGRRGRLHVSRETSSGSPRRRPTADRNYIDVTPSVSRRRTTTRRDGSTPSLSLRTPSTAATAS